MWFQNPVLTLLLPSSEAREKGSRHQIAGCTVQFGIWPGALENHRRFLSREGKYSDLG